MENKSDLFDASEVLRMSINFISCIEMSSSEPFLVMELRDNENQTQYSASKYIRELTNYNRICLFFGNNLQFVQGVLLN